MIGIIRAGSLSTLIAASLAAAMLIFSLAPALADEEIRSFDSVVTLATDGSVDVTETIVINAEGNQIRHGIYRDIPTTPLASDKSALAPVLTVVDIERDGEAEPFVVQDLAGSAKRLRIGSADVLLDPKVYTYAIHYTMTRMGQVFDDHDELVWNATGENWSFPILKATATLNLPQGALINGAFGYTGTPGTVRQAVHVTARTANSISFVTTRTLVPGEGLQVGAMFQKGILALPASAMLQIKVASR